MLTVSEESFCEKMEVYIDKVANVMEVVKIIRENNKHVVILSERNYNNLMENNYLLENKSNYDWLMESKMQLENKNKE